MHCAVHTVCVVVTNGMKVHGNFKTIAMSPGVGTGDTWLGRVLKNPNGILA